MTARRHILLAALVTMMVGAVLFVMTMVSSSTTTESPAAKARIHTPSLGGVPTSNSANLRIEVPGFRPKTATPCSTPCSLAPSATLVLPAYKTSAITLVAPTKSALSISIAASDHPASLPPTPVSANSIDVHALAPGSYLLVVTAGTSTYVLNVILRPPPITAQ